MSRVQIGFAILFSFLCLLALSPAQETDGGVDDTPKVATTTLIERGFEHLRADEFDAAVRTLSEAIDRLNLKAKNFQLQRTETRDEKKLEVRHASPGYSTQRSRSSRSRSIASRDDQRFPTPPAS